jgi:hypothetical protein
VGCGTQDESWTERVAGMTIPDGVSTLGKIIKTERNLHPLITKTTAVGAFMNPTAFMNPKANFPAHVHSPLEEGELAEQDGKVAKRALPTPLHYIVHVPSHVLCTLLFICPLYFVF